MQEMSQEQKIYRNFLYIFHSCDISCIEVASVMQNYEIRAATNYTCHPAKHVSDIIVLVIQLFVFGIFLVFKVKFCKVFLCGEHIVLVELMVLAV